MGDSLSNPGGCYAVRAGAGTGPLFAFMVLSFGNLASSTSTLRCSLGRGVRMSFISQFSHRKARVYVIQIKLRTSFFVVVCDSDCGCVWWQVGGGGGG